MKLHKSKKDQNLYYYFNVKKEKRWMFRYRYYDSLGKRRERSRQGFYSESEAYRALLEVRVTIENGGVKQIENENLTVAEWLDLWYETKQTRWKVSTRYQRKRYIEGVIKPLIGNRKLSKLDKMTYERIFINDLLKNYSPSSVKAYHDIVQIAFNAAVENETIKKNVLRTVTIPDNRKKEENFLSREDLKTLLTIGEKFTNVTNYTMLLLLALTGVRKGEAQGLTWKDIDYDKQTIKIERTRDNDGVRPPKTRRSYREIQIDRKLVKQLKLYHNWCKQLKLSNGTRIKVDEFIFITTHGGNPISPNTFNLALNSLIKKAKIKHITPHGLRHTHATILLNSGLSVAAVAKRLGNTAQEINRTYGHAGEEEDKRASEEFSRAMNL